MEKILQSSNGSIRLTVVGKINLPSKKPVMAKAKRKFVPFSGGATIGAILKSQGISLR